MQPLVNICLVFVLLTQSAIAQDKTSLLSKADLLFLEKMTKDVMDSSRIRPGQFISKEFGANNTGGSLVRPGGRNAYPSFWIRDYAMSLETGFVTIAEQKHMLQLTAATQCDQSWITKGGSMVPLGSIADHIRIDNSLPVYFPGTYSYEEQGVKEFGRTPPYCDQFYFIHMASYYAKTTGNTVFLAETINNISLIDRLEMAFKVVPSRADNHLVYTNDQFRGVDFGFRDAVEITGDLCFASLLKYQAANEMADLFHRLNNKNKVIEYKQIAAAIKKAIPPVFSDERGMLRASSGKSKQPDVWSTALAVYMNVLEGEDQQKASKILGDAFKAGTLAYKGNIRHILTSDDFSETTAWEKAIVAKNTYQNGAYWGTPTGWVCNAIAVTDRSTAQKLAKEYIDDLRENDFRKGGKAAAPYECFHPSGNFQNPLYLTTVACPYIAFKKLLQ
ncbi:MAG: hypothetical protein KF862_27420 [Chitinophagaceae bacterium]|nr:hypothetical protein [Chitinophagaceae bacterium]